jgi:hypothetical protein
MALDGDKLLRRANEILERVTPHECRHTFASLMIAAGVNAKALSTFMGHATISITLDRYGHLFPGSEGEAAELLDAYLNAREERAAEQARAAEALPTGASAGALPTLEEAKTALASGKRLRHSG